MQMMDDLGNSDFTPSLLGGGVGLGTLFIEELSPGLRTAWEIAALASVGACAYHGYKRTQSVGWAIGWAAVGALFPVVSVGIALAQGFGKAK